MNIAGVGLEQDVVMENVDMKIGPVTGAAGMAGVAASPHLLYFVILSVFRAVCGSIFGWLQAVGRYVRHPQGRRARRAPVLSLPTLCLALAVVFFNPVGAMAQGAEVCENPDPTSDECTNPLVADAGQPATWNSRVTVTLDGSGSMDDLGGMITDYAWVRTGGTMGGTVTLTNADKAMATFTADTLDPGADDVEHTFKLTVTDDDGFSKTDTVTITINAPPKAVVLVDGEAESESTVNSGASVSLDGRMSEDDGTEMLTYAWTRADRTTTGLTNPTTATASFTPPTLADGDPDATHILTLTVSDEGGKTSLKGTATSLTHAAMVTIKVISDFADPVAIIAGAAEREVASGGTVDLDGSGSTFDSRRTPLTYAWTRAAGTTTGLTDPNTATPVFTPPTLADGDPDATHILTLTVTDSANESDTAMVTITVISDFADPVAIIAGAAEREVASGGTVDLDGSGSTFDSRRTPLTYAWTRAAGTTTGLTDPNTATPVFTPPTLADGDPDATHILTLTVTDSANESDTAMVTITVISDFADPVAIITGAAEREVASGGTVDLDGSGSTFDSRRAPLTYAWTRAAGTTTGLTDPNTATPVFTPPTLADGDPDATHILTLTVTDSANESDTAMVTITVISDFADPVAIITGAAEREVASGGTVDLDGSGSTFDSRRAPLTYAWIRAAGTTTGLTDPNTATPVFTPPTLADGDPDATHILTLTVTDSANESDTAMVTITVISDFADPVAIITGAAEREVASGGTVDLDGSGSTFDSRRAPLTYAWTRAAGTTTGLTDPNTATSVFTPPTLADGDPDATHILTLTVTDSANESDTAMVTITVISDFADPVAIITGAAEREVASGGTVDLDGSGSTFDSRRAPLTYAWTRAAGTTTGLTDPNTATPVFTSPTLADGDPDATHILTLTVTDSANESDTAMVTITVISDFADPVAIITGAAEREVASGGTVDLDGSGSTFDSRRAPLTYAWTRAAGTTTGLTDPNTATPVFTPPTLADGDPDATHILTLTVTDSANESDTAMVTITVISDFADPVAIITGAAEREVASGGTVDLDGSGSTFDSRRTPLTYAWTRAAGTTTGLTDPNTATPVFTPPTLADGDPDATHILTLTVTDSANESDTAMVTITVISDFADPVAIITGAAEREVASGGTVDLDGNGSTHDDRTTLTYAWTRADGTTTGLTTPTMATASFTPPTLADGADDVTHVLTLTVTDSEGGTDAATVTVTVTAVSVDIVVSPPDLKVQEGGSGTYRVRLRESPGREVIVMADSDIEAVVRLKNTRLVFNADNWNDWQEVEIDAVADSVKKGDSIEVTIRHSLNGVASSKFAVVTVSVRAQEDDPIPDHVGQFIATRATTLLGQQPDLIHFLKQDGLTQDSGGSFTFQATDGRLSLDGGFIHDGTWGEVTGARTNSESTDTKSVLGSFGIHRKYSETFLTGLMLQFDRADHELPQQTGTIDGTGWLVGPYFVARHGSQPLYFEGRLLYGYSDNDIRFMDRHLGARTGSFDSTRVLAQIRVEGEIAVPGWDHGDDGGAEVPQLIPYADLRWLEDRAAAFTTVSATTGFRVPVPGQTVNISQLELGSNMVVPVAVPTGSMILTGGLGLVFSNTEGNHIKSVARGRGRGEIGFSYGLDENVQIDFESFYDGIGSSGYEGYGLSLNAEMRF